MRTHLYTDKSGCRAPGTFVWSLAIGNFCIGWCRPAYLIVGRDGHGYSLRIGWGAYRG